jgi:hypothetical protein
MPYVINPLGRNAINSSVQKGLPEDLSQKINSSQMSLNEFNLLPPLKIDDRRSLEGDPVSDIMMGWNQLIVSQKILKMIPGKTLSSYATMSVLGIKGRPHPKRYTMIYIPRHLAVDCIDTEASQLVWQTHPWGEYWSSASPTYSPTLSLRGKSIPDLDIFLAKPYGPKGIYIVSDRFYHNYLSHKWTGCSFDQCNVIN